MDIDEIKWDPISIREINVLFSRFKIPWWISGGWALDLYIGKQMRTLPYLNQDQIRRLWMNLKRQYPEGHRAISVLEESKNLPGKAN
ncbi:MAG TPA: hypothetical protein VHY08_23455 [Bacillota bacterium]|nr:hypothetical protein [Bacillota bacterium]